MVSADGLIDTILEPILVMEEFDDLELPRGELKVVKIELTLFDTFDPALELLPSGRADLGFHLPYALSAGSKRPRDANGGPTTIWI